MGKISGWNNASTKSPELLGTSSVRTGLFDLGVDVVHNFKYVQSLKEKYEQVTLFTNKFNMLDFTDDSRKITLYNFDDCRLEEEKFSCCEPFFRPINMGHTKGK